MNATEQIKQKILSDPIFKKHQINFVNLDGSVERRISTGILDDGTRVPGVMVWRDEEGIIFLTPIANYRHIFFDEVHRDMVEEGLRKAEEEARLKNG